MARSRNIKPQFFLNEYLATKSTHARLLFIGLWCLADCKGRMEDRPLRIKAALFPYESIDIDSLLNELAHGPERFIIRYKVEANRYIEITNFSRHQNPHKKEKEVGSQLPPCPEFSGTRPGNSGTGTVPDPIQHQTSPADSLLLIPDSLTLKPDDLVCVSPVEKVTDENQTLAQAGLDYLLSLNHPNFSSPLWVKGYLSLQFQELAQTRPNIPKAEILRLWRDTCDLATDKNKPGPGWSKSTFQNKLEDWTPEQVKKPAPDQTSGDQGAKVRALLEFPFIRHILTDEIFNSETLEVRPDALNGLTNSATFSYYPIAHLEGLTEMPA
jgi:hypothetical protein